MMRALVVYLSLLVSIPASAAPDVAWCEYLAGWAVTAGIARKDGATRYQMLALSSSAPIAVSHVINIVYDYPPSFGAGTAKRLILMECQGTGESWLDRSDA